MPYTKHIDSYYDENTDSKFNKERNTYSKAILVWYNTGLQSQPEEGNQVYDYFIEVEVESGDTSTQVADKTSVILSNIIETDVNGNEIKLFGCDGSGGSINITCLSSPYHFSFKSETSGISIGDKGVTLPSIRDTVEFYRASTFDGVITNQAAATSTIDWAKGNKQLYNFIQAAAKTLEFLTPQYNDWSLQRLDTGAGSFQLIISQPASGSGTITWPASVKWAGGSAPTLSSGGQKIDIVSFLYDAGTYYATISKDFS